MNNVYKIKHPEDLKKNKKYDYINLYSCFIDLEQKFNNLNLDFVLTKNNNKEKDEIILKLTEENNKLKQDNNKLKQQNNDLNNSLNKIKVITDESTKKNNIIIKIKDIDNINI